MTPDDQAETLAEAEREFRQAIPNSWGDALVPDWALVLLMAEYTRRGAVVEAATALADHEFGGGTRDGAWFERNGELFNALIEAVKGYRRG